MKRVIALAVTALLLAGCNPTFGAQTHLGRREHSNKLTSGLKPEATALFSEQRESEFYSYQTGEKEKVSQEEFGRLMQSEGLILIRDTNLGPSDEMDARVSIQLLASNLQDVVELVPRTATEIYLLCGEGGTALALLLPNRDLLKENMGFCVGVGVFTIIYFNILDTGDA